jgi:hypothetical protein
MEPSRLILEPWRIEEGQLLLAARLKTPGAAPQRLWWSLPEAWSDAVTPWADPFVVAMLFPMMQGRRPVMVEGRVSPSLLRNLETYMAIWRAWVPDRYQPVAIRAAEEIEPPPPAQPAASVVPFSCGVDSCYTLLRHRRKLMGRRNRSIGAGVVMHGFDIWLDQPNASAMFAGMLESARRLLDSQGVACIPMTSNFHELPTVWGHSFAAQLVGGLRLLGGRFGSALMPNNIPYIGLGELSASHPASNPHMGSQAFEVVDDGGESGRVEMVELLAQWPEAKQNLRVCFENPGSHTNCCRCEKCIRTILSFRAAGYGLPPAFSQDVTDRQIRRVRLHRDIYRVLWEQMVRDARQRGLGDASWCQAARAALRRYARRSMWKRFNRRFLPLRGGIRRLFRGSDLSRKQRAKRVAAETQ